MQLNVNSCTILSNAILVCFAVSAKLLFRRGLCLKAVSFCNHAQQCEIRATTADVCSRLYSVMPAETKHLIVLTVGRTLTLAIPRLQRIAAPFSVCNWSVCSLSSGSGNPLRPILQGRAPIFCLPQVYNLAAWEIDRKERFKHDQFPFSAFTRSARDNITGRHIVLRNFLQNGSGTPRQRFLT